jgi:hypothetical protein
MPEQDGITLAEAIDAYGWHQPFSELVNDLRSRYPEEFAAPRSSRKAGRSRGSRSPALRRRPPWRSSSPFPKS